MERTLEMQLEESIHNPGITGVLCVDNNGLCLGAKGSAPLKACGSISALAGQAAKLANPNGPTPVICLESEHGIVLIKKTDKLTTALFKSS
ncbi:unnamed protein product [Lymnaea stagnalis]|uniref:Late endosomal/lysosomal adaptor and MAPK and MTOR activator 5 n=1 Tax=Lymnaea stagnalis TaxID=6523 RepID=A0AAV2H5D9_LYMST